MSMAISDRDRKILWAKSGNQCAICRRVLVTNSTQTQDVSLIGEECHIVSSKPGGPRYDSSFPSNQIDSYDNLILLCRVHHREVDDLCIDYPKEILIQKKKDHEAWVSSQLSLKNFPGSKLTIKRDSKKIPEFLIRLMSGREILNVVLNSHSYSFEADDELKSEREIKLVGDFFQILEDVDAIPEMGKAYQLRIEFDLSRSIEELDHNGFWVFGGREKQILEGGINSPSNWIVAILRIVRKNNEAIISFTPNHESVE